MVNNETHQTFCFRATRRNYCHNVGPTPSLSAHAYIRPTPYEPLPLGVVSGHAVEGQVPTAMTGKFAWLLVA